MSKKVILISFAFSLVGLFAEFLMLLPFDESQFSLFAEVQHALTILQMRTTGVLEYARTSPGLRISFSDVVCYLMLLAGAMLYSKSKGREARLIRFVLAIVLMSNALTVLFSILVPSAFRSEFQVESSWGWVIYGIILIKNGALVYFSYQALRVLHAEKVVATVESGTPEEPVALPQEASGGQRFVNAVIDLTVCVAIFLPLGVQLVPDFLVWMEQTLGARNAVIILLVLARTIYYILFEIVLSATPGKFMTESRVMDVDNEPATPGHIIIRTLTRFIPFEPLSYFWNGLWHDNISYTRVVREERTGVEGGLYLLIIPVVIVLGIVHYIIIMP